jgi:hypothetical protein
MEEHEEDIMTKKASELRASVCAALSLVLLGTGNCHAFWWWRDSMTSRWAEAPIRVTVPDMEWEQTEALEDSGFNFRARNDSVNLYLMISAMDRDSRSVMKGTYRQDVVLWSLGPKDRSRNWGLRLAFSRLERPTGDAPIRGEVTLIDARTGAAGMAADQKPAGEHLPRPVQERSRGFPLSEESPMVEPEMVLPTGIEVSSVLPSDIEFHSESARRETAYTVRIPLNRLNPAKGKSVLFDFVVSDVSPELKSEFEAKNGSATGGPAAGIPSGAGRGGEMEPGMGGGGRMAGAMGPMSGGIGGGMGAGGKMGMELETDGSTMHGGMTGEGGPGRGGEMGRPPIMRPQELPGPVNLRLTVRLAQQSDAKQ